MTVEQLAEELAEVIEAGYGDAEVLLAHQPNWPLALTVACIATPDDLEPDEDDTDPVVWIASGEHPYGRSPYAPRGAWVA